MPERVVLDTNVLISGLLWRGKAYQCVLLARVGIVQAIYCPQMTAVLSDVLRLKFQFSENRVRAVVHDLQRFAERVEIGGRLAVVTADPDDDKFIECAVVGGAEVIVSDDRHLLGLGEYEGIPIMSSADFVEWIAGRPEMD
jgi:putative PIN family toxin of toxin-antitoxin system